VHELEQKSFPVVQLKALGDEGAGQFEAIVAVFGNIDSYGDRMVKGCFERTLRAPPEGRGFPAVVWSHQWGMVPIGASLEAEEVEKGLRIVGQLLIEDHSTAREVYAAMKLQGGDGLPALREFSFAFFIVDSAEITEDGETIREIKDVDLLEVGPTLIGANSETELIGVRAAPVTATTVALERSLHSVIKAAELKEGQVLSAANRGLLEDAIVALEKVLASAKPKDEPKDGSTPPDPDPDDADVQERELAARELLLTFPR
jgi:HK97 family phage prohead protease